MRARALASRLACAWVAVLSIACEPRDQTPVGRGARIFQRTCASCHGRDGRGVMRLGLAKPPRDLTNPEFHARVTDEDLRRVIRIGKGQMPAFGGLMGAEDLNAVIAFIRTLPPGAKPPPPSVPQPSAPPPSAPAPSAPQPLAPQPLAPAQPLGAAEPASPAAPAPVAPTALVAPAREPDDKEGMQ